jgi:sulfhydrogenase subunit gamma (sulfur reductase)
MIFSDMKQSITLSDQMDIQQGLYTPIMARIARIQQITELEKLFTIELPEGISLGHRPGQFVEVSILGVGEAPISISSSPSRSSRSFEICVRKVGDLTNALHLMKEGDVIGLRGPFGRGFPFENLHGKDILFAAGGLGLAPLRSFINQVIDQRSSFGRVIILYGARNPAELLFTNELQEWGNRQDVEFYVTVDRGDDDWDGNVGVITTLFKKISIYPRNTVAATCGPPVMYRFVLMELNAIGISEGNIYLSLERHMKCGVGKCGHCQINDLYACQSGPVFPYSEIKGKEEAL